MSKNPQHLMEIFNTCDNKKGWVHKSHFIDSISKEYNFSTRHAYNLFTLIKDHFEHKFLSRFVYIRSKEHTDVPEHSTEEYLGEKDMEKSMIERAQLMIKELSEELDRKNKEIEDIKNAPKVTFKVSKKGCISIYGIRKKYPISLYPKEWELVIDNIDNLSEFIKESNGVNI